MPPLKKPVLSRFIFSPTIKLDSTKNCKFRKEIEVGAI